MQPQRNDLPDLVTTIASAEPLPAENDGRPTVRYFGEYELLGEIARGGMGVVYKAKQRKLNRLVALKMILSGQLASDDQVRRFQTEAEAVARLDHPGIVSIYEVGEHEGQHYFSMTFVDGTSLSAAVVDAPFSPKEAAQVVKRVTEAMAYAHDRGVIHRDLKPANILLARIEDFRPSAVYLTAAGIQPGWYEPKVMDFGLAKNIEGNNHLTGTGQILGTPSFMSPEQAAGKTEQIGPLADVYSLGAILYCLLTGRPPFQSANVMDTLRQVLEKDPIALRQLNPQIPRDLETLCLKCLQKDPSQRYASARTLAQEIARFENGEPIQARPVGIPMRLWRWCKRKPIVSGLTAMLATLLITGTTVVTILWNRAEKNLQLANSRTQELRDYLNHTIDHPQATHGLKVAAASGLWKLDRDVDAVLPTLIAGLQATDFNVGEVAANTLGEMGSDAYSAIPALIEAAKHPPQIAADLEGSQRWHTFRGGASRAIALIGVSSQLRPDLIQALTDCQEDDNDYNDFQFLELLSLIDTDSKTAIPRHLKGITTNQMGENVWAREYLIRLNPSAASAIDQLIVGLMSESVAVRRWCAAALIKMSPAIIPAVPALVKSLKDSDAVVAQYAAFALGTLGAEARPVISELNMAKQNAELELSAEWAIAQIQKNEVIDYTLIPKLSEETRIKFNQGDPTTPIREVDDSLENLSDSRETFSPAEIDYRKEAHLLTLDNCIAAVADRKINPSVRKNIIQNLARPQTRENKTWINRLQNSHPRHFAKLKMAYLAVLSDGDSAVRAHALRSITAFGEHAEFAIPALIVGIHYDPYEEDGKVKRNQDALKQIAPRFLP